MNYYFYYLLIILLQRLHIRSTGQNFISTDCPLVPCCCVSPVSQQKNNNMQESLVLCKCQVHVSQTVVRGKAGWATAQLVSKLNDCHRCCTKTDSEMLIQWKGLTLCMCRFSITVTQHQVFFTVLMVQSDSQCVECVCLLESIQKSSLQDGSFMISQFTVMAIDFVYITLTIPVQ